jgi:RNA recognition motif-containing protein
MAKSIYVGNLPFNMTESQLHDLFAQHGTVHSAKVITDRDTGRPRGFGFVEMDDEAAAVAIRQLNGREIQGRALRVNEAQQRATGGPRRPARRP